MEAGFLAEADHLRGVSEKIIFGQLPSIGTGCFSLLNFKEKLKEGAKVS